VPLFLAFDSAFSHQLTITIMTTIVFMMDTWVDIHTIRPEQLPQGTGKNLNLRQWKLKYLSSWQPYVDFVIALPLDLLPLYNAQYFLLIRLLRLPKLGQIMSRSPIYVWIRQGLEKALGIGQAFSSIFALMFLLSAYLHFQSCILIMLAKAFGYTNPILFGTTNFEQYTWSLFQAVGNTFPLTYR
jgi:hypothetical protein